MKTVLKSMSRLLFKNVFYIFPSSLNFYLCLSKLMIWLPNWLVYVAPRLRSAFSCATRAASACPQLGSKHFLCHRLGLDTGRNCAGG